MKASTMILTICLSVLALIAAPIVSHPMPNNIIKEGRDFNSRFAPIARPVFPRSYYENETASTTVEAKKPKKTKATLPLIKREYPAGPTASAHFEPKKPKKEKDTSRLTKREYHVGPTASAEPKKTKKEKVTKREYPAGPTATAHSDPKEPKKPKKEKHDD